MARATSVFVLLKTLELFVRDVPIDPRYQRWVKTRAKMKGAVKNIEKRLMTLRGLRDIDLESILPPRRKASAKDTILAGCGKPGPKSLA